MSLNQGILHMHFPRLSAFNFASLNLFTNLKITFSESRYDDLSTIT